MQTDIDQMFTAFSLGTTNLREIVDRHDPASEIAKDPGRALVLVRDAAKILEKYVDVTKLHISKGRNL